MSDAPSGPGPRPPLLGGRYVVVDRVGGGGAAEVFLAFDLPLQRWRALKVMHPTEATKPEMRARFDLEATTLARLDHPNAVRVLDVKMGDLPYMVMEYAEGGSVLEGMRVHGALAPEQAVRVAIDVLQALEATHAQQVVHRDVKPHNVLVDRHGRAKLTDFGIAKQRGSHEEATKQGLTKVGEAMGTGAFMPPEQQHDASSVDHRADIYALGATLFAMLTAKRPRDLYVADAADAQLASMPEVLRPIVLKACAYQPEGRYPTARAFREALEATLPIVGRGSGRVFPALLSPPGDVPERLGADAVVAVGGLVVGGAVTTAWAGPDAEVEEGAAPSVPIDAAAYGASPEPPPPEPPKPKPPPKPEPPAEPPPDPEAEAARRRLLAGVLFGALLLLVLGGGLVGVLETARSGAYAVVEARTAEREAVMALDNLLETQAPLVKAMAAAGADGERLREAFFAFRDAPDASRATAAAAFVAVLADEQARLTRSDEAIDGAWRKVSGQAQRVEAARAEVDAAEASPSAALASTLGLL